MNYKVLADAVDFYRERGYFYVQDAPWYVSKAAYHATKPLGAPDVHVFSNKSGALSFPSDGFDNQYLVASGEQSFIQMLLDGVDLKRAMCVTPCHRVEIYNDWHKPYFMKVELINAQDTDEGHLLHMVHEASSFFEILFANIRIKQTGKQSYDIIEKDSRVELGSYGIREVVIDRRPYRWIYGTGCAEPRTSTTMMRVDVKKST